LKTKGVAKIILEPAEMISKPAENILEGSLASSVTPLVISEPSFKADGAAKMILEPAERFFAGWSAHGKILFPVPGPSPAPGKVPIQDSRVSIPPAENKTIKNEGAKPKKSRPL